MILTINKKDFSFSPDTLIATGGRKHCNILIHPDEQLMLLKPSSKTEKDVVDISRSSISCKDFIGKLRQICGWSAYATITCDGEPCPQGVLFKLKEATVDTHKSIFTIFRKKHVGKPYRPEKKGSFSCWNRYKKSSNANI